MNLVNQAKKASDAQLKELLDDKSFLVRAAAMDELSDRLNADFDEKQLKILTDAVRETRNRKTVVRGTITVSHIGIAAIARIKRFKAREIFLKLLSELKENDLKDLIWYLETKDISVPTSEIHFV